MNINDVLKDPAYDFLKTHERLGNHIDLLVFGGSISYGLNGPNSDIDIRGITSPLRRDLLAYPYMSNPLDLVNPDVKLTNFRFEEYVDSNTDTCIYNIMKYMKLVYACNPNTIEILGCLPEHYAHVSEAGQLLLDSKDLFVTKTAYYSFGEYARDQLVRLQNAIARNSSNLDRLLQVISIIKRSYAHFEVIYPGFKKDMIEFYLVDARDEKIKTKTTKTFFESEELSEEEIRENLSDADLDNVKLMMNVNIRGISSSDFHSIMNHTYDIIKNFSATGHRNHKKNDEKIEKHASHLRRLQIKGKEILRDKKIVTHCGEHIPYLLDLKHGMYRNDDGTYQKEFFDDVNRDMDEMLALYKASDLPKVPDITKVIKLAEQINELAWNR